MRTIQQWLDEYGESHRNAFNKFMHWLCVPLIVFSLLGLLWLLPFPEARIGPLPVNWCLLFLLFSLAYYLLLSWRLAIGMLLVCVMVYSLLVWLDTRLENLLLIYGSIFIIAWIGQFVGHQVEGRRPSFFKDVQFLLIGPLWLLSAVYRKLRLAY